MSTPSPITPTTDQAAVIAALQAFAAMLNVEIDASPLDEPAGACDHDWAHDHGVICTRDGDRLCPGCGRDWLRWYPGEHVAIDVLRVPDSEEMRAAA